MPRRVIRKWRPPLVLVLGGVLVAVLALPLVGLAAMQVLESTMGAVRAGLLVASVVLFATLVLGYLLWRLLLRPIAALATRAEALKDGDAAALAPLDHYGTRELSDLVQTVLDMAETLHDRAATIRSYTDHVTHELKTPITAISGAIEMLQGSGGQNAQDRQLIAAMRASARRMEDLLVALRNVAAAREPSYKGRTNLGEVAAALRAGFSKLELQIEGSAISVPMRAEGLEIILQHFLRNAAEHGADRVVLNASVEGPQIHLRISDNGTGISHGNRAQVFSPFFTTRREAGGTGMGLSIAQSIVQGLGGQIILLPEGPGAQFLIAF